MVNVAVKAEELEVGDLVLVNDLQTDGYDVEVREVKEITTLFSKGFVRYEIFIRKNTTHD